MRLNPEELSAELMARSRDARDADDRVRAAASTLVELGVADGVSISERLGDGEFRTRAATDERSAAVDALQYELGEGPCVDAVYEQGVLSCGDGRDDPRWPRWGSRAVELGLSAVISVRLYSSGKTTGALNLFYARPQEFVFDDLETARAIATLVSMELARSRHDEHLWRAVDARHRVGQAQGILMRQYDFDADEAWAVLRRLSQQGNTKLHVIAEQIIQGRGLQAELGASADT